MKRYLWPIVIPGLLLSAGCAGRSDGVQQTAGPDIEIVNVSYDPTRELYQELNAAFANDFKRRTGKSIKVTQSHGGSGAQARAVIDGLQADVVTLGLAGDIDAIARKGLLKDDWEQRWPNHSSPYSSAIVLVVRKGNPKGIKDWPDLTSAGVNIITPNPKTSGGARWNFLAAWGYITLSKKGTETEAQELVAKIYRNTIKLDSGARGATQSLVKNKLGDVLIAWENDAILARKEVPDQHLEIIYPSISILAEPPVAVIDRTVDQRGTRGAAEAYLKFLYTDAAQDIIGKNSYRPANPTFQKKYAGNLPPISLFTIRDVAGSWSQAQQKFFGDGGLFDQIYKGNRN
jgi:sulfate/thiosulfate-binding protein